jgi:hypothetical protein
MGVKMRQSPLRSEATPVTDKDAEVVADSQVNCANVIEWQFLAYNTGYQFHCPSFTFKLNSIRS